MTLRAMPGAHRDKKSITVDISDPAQRARLVQLIVEKADVCIQNMRTGAVETLGLDGPALLERNPRLVYCNMGAYGTKGPLSHLPGYDPLIQGFTGICHVTGPKGGDPCRVRVPVVDLGTGMWAVIGIQAALMRRQVTGCGGVVDVSLFDTAMGWMTLAMSTVMVTGKTPGRYGTRGPGALAPNQGFAAADGMIMITAGTDPQFTRLAQALGCPQWAHDERFNSARTRAENAVELCQQMEDVIATESRSVWMERLNEANVPNAPIHTPLETFEHPQIQASGLLQGSEDGAARQIAIHLTIDGKRLPYRRRAPALGEHNALLSAHTLTERRGRDRAPVNPRRGIRPRT